MEVKAIMKNARMSPQKVREVVRQIQGLPAVDAVNVLRFVPRKSARLVLKTLKSAMANAENNFKLNPSTLVISQAVALKGRVLKRWIPKARGSAGPILKRSCHIQIVLSEKEEKPQTSKEQKAEAK